MVINNLGSFVDLCLPLSSLINSRMKADNLLGSDSKLPVYNITEFLERLALVNI
jgi:hypothetical protein